MGIEPTLFAWEARVLPLNDTRDKLRILARRQRLQTQLAVKAARLSSEGVGEGDVLRQQLQRARKVALGRIVDGGVQAVTAQPQAQRSHVHAQLVALAADRFQA